MLCRRNLTPSNLAPVNASLSFFFSPAMTVLVRLLFSLTFSVVPLLLGYTSLLIPLDIIL